MVDYRKFDKIDYDNSDDEEEVKAVKPLKPLNKFSSSPVPSLDDKAEGAKSLSSGTEAPQPQR